MNRLFFFLASLVMSAVALSASAQGPAREVRHNGPVWCVAFSPDGKLLASGGQDGVLRLTELATGKEVKRFQLTTAIMGVAFSHDGTQLAIKPAGEPLGRYDAATGKLLKAMTKTYAQHDVRHLAFTTNGQTLVACGAGARIVWQVNNNSTTGSRTAKPPEGSFAAVAPDGGHVAQGNPTKGTVQVQQTDDPSKSQNFKVGRATAAAFTPDGRSLVTANDDRLLHQWAIAGKAKQRTIKGPEQPVGRLVFSGDGKILAGLALPPAAPEAWVWDFERGILRRRFNALGAAVNDLALSPDGKTLALAGNDGQVRLWNVSLRDLERPKAFVPIPEEELQRLWDELADKDRDRADAAFRRLAQGGDHTLPFLKSRVRKVAVPELDAQRLEKLLRDLDAPAFAVRERASVELASFGELAEKRLREVLAANPSTEVDKRVRLLIGQLKESGLTPDRVRALEAIELLEWLNTPAARQVLEEIARDGLVPRVQTEAAAALQRLARAGKSRATDEHG